MSTLDTMRAALHDPKHRTLRQRFEMVTIVFILSGAWSAAGYLAGNKVAADTVQKLEAGYNEKLQALREKQGKELDALKLTCAKKEIAK